MDQALGIDLVVSLQQAVPAHQRHDVFQVGRIDRLDESRGRRAPDIVG
jgi:hypothetical protein